MAAESLANLAPERRRVQILVSDGLSAEAVHHNMRDLLPVLLDGLAGRGIETGQPLLAQYGRVKLAEPIAERVQAELIIHLIGERPGGDALASRSLSAYLAYRLVDPEAQHAAAQFSGNPAIRFEYTVISNISTHRRNVPSRHVDKEELVPLVGARRWHRRWLETDHPGAAKG